MHSIKMYTSAALALVAMALGVTSASAANWDPPNTTVAGSGGLTFGTNTGSTISCTITLSLRSTGNDVSTSVGAPVFDNCSSNISNPTIVRSDNDWTVTATTTTSVDLAFNYTMNIGSGLCVITANAAIAGNTWSNATHTLTPSSAATWPITEHGFCDGGTSAHWSGSITFPASAIIT